MDEELLTLAELSERVLRCDVKTAEKHIVNRPNFPYIWVGERRRFPKKMVEKWIEENTHYV